MSELAQYPDFSRRVSEYLLARSRTVATPRELNNKKAEFESIYRILPTVAEEFLAAYKNITFSYGLDPGEVRLYMVGGRVHGRPLKEDSDIDLIICVEHPKQSPGAPIPGDQWHALEALDYKMLMMDSVRRALAQVCNNHAIPNHFHILSYGSSLPEDKDDGSRSLLLAIG